MTTGNIRPLSCQEPGVWLSYDGNWTFLRHESDPRPQRWFAYEGNNEEPTFFGGHFSLSAAVQAVERLNLAA